jgi:hypothetical protein
MTFLLGLDTAPPWVQWLVVLLIVWVVWTLASAPRSRREGLAVQSTDASQTTASASAGGEAGLAGDYEAALKARVVQLQDVLLISKYRTAYESTLLSLDEYLGLLQLKYALHLPLSGEATPAEMDSIARLASVQQVRDSLAPLIAFLDKQP